MQAIETQLPPSSPNSPAIPDETKLIIHDKLQQTFRCKRKSLLLSWRNVLLKRYAPFKDAGSGLRVIRDERDSNRDPLSLPLCLPSLPKTLSKTFCQVYFDQIKCLTLTLYYNKGGDGSCLIQGNKCNQWIMTEFQVISDIVTRLQTKKRTDKAGNFPAIEYPKTDTTPGQLLPATQHDDGKDMTLCLRDPPAAHEDGGGRDPLAAEEGGLRDPTAANEEGGLRDPPAAKEGGERM